MKKWLSVIFCLCLLTQLFGPVGVLADDATASATVVTGGAAGVEGDSSATTATMGSCGDNLTWTLYGDGTLIIDGQGDMWDYHFVSNPAPWGTAITSVTIRDGVTSIGADAFKMDMQLAHVTIADSVERIGSSAFDHCWALNTIDLPDNLTHIGEGAFSYAALTTVVIPDSVESIGNSAFYCCDSLTDVTIGNGVKNLADYVFAYCDSLTSINIPNNVESIGWYALHDCNALETVTIGNGVTQIFGSAFSFCEKLTSFTVAQDNPAYCSVDGVLMSADQTVLVQYPIGGDTTSYTVPDGVKEIQDAAFAACNTLTTVTLPDSVESLGSYVFDGCNSLTTVTIGSGLREMQIFNFQSSSLQNIIVSEDNEHFSSVDGVLFDGYQTQLRCYPSGKTETSYTIPNNVFFICDNAFANCASLTEVTIPNRETIFEDRAFYQCSNLTIHGHTGSTAEIYATENNIPFVALTGGSTTTTPSTGTDTDPTVPTIPGGDDDNEPEDELSITIGQTLTVEIVAEQTTYIKFVPTASGVYTFTSLSDEDTYGFLYDANKIQLDEDDDDGDSLNFSITHELEGGKTYYWSARFYSDQLGGELDVKLVCDQIFCDHVNTTDYPAEDATCTTDGYTAGTYCADCQMWITGHEFVAAHHTDDDGNFLCDLCGEDATEIVANGECGDALTWELYNNGNLIIKGTGEMRHWDFFNTYSPWTYYSELIRRVVIEEGVTSIGQNAFCSIDSYFEYDRHFYPLLTEIVIPNTVTTIHTNGISGTTALETINLPASVTTLVGAAFNNNLGLKQYVVDEANPAFKAVDGVLFSKDGKTLVAYPIGSQNESYTVPNGVDTIGAYAFSQCTSQLTEVVFNDGLRFIDDEAFQNCDGLTAISLPDSLKELGGGVFQECSSLIDINLPRNMTRIGGLVFDCTAYYNDWNNWEDNVLYIDGYLLDTIYRPPHLDWDEWKEKEGTLTVREGTTLIADEAVDSLGVTAVEFNSELQYIGFCSFGWLDITTISLPSSLISLGDWAFYNCESLTTIQMGDNVKYIGHDVFGNTPYDNEANYVDGVLYYGPYALGFNSDLPNNVMLRDGTTLIAERAFWKEDGLLTTPDYGAPMASIMFPESLTTICDGAFYSCNNLNEVTIPACVTYIGHHAFGWIKGYDTSYDEETYTKMNDFAISGYTDSAAHVYAVTNGIPFTALDDDDNEGSTTPSNPEGGEGGDSTTPTNPTNPGGDYGEGGGNDGPTVTVKFPVAIAITSLPQRVVFTIGEELDTTGLGVSIRYDDNSVEPLYTYSILGYQSNVPGVQTITVNHEGFTATFTVFVEAPLCKHQNVTVHQAVDSTCTAHGHGTYTTCDNCQEVISGSDAALPLLGHNYSDATCTAPKTCSRCGDTVGEALGHKYDSGKVTKAATCKATGIKTFTCTVCKSTKTQTIAKNTNHKYDSGKVTKTATCKATGIKTFTCTVCKGTKTQTIAKNTNHKYDSGKVTKAATCKATGIKTFTCTVCKSTKTQTIAKSTAHSYKTTTTKATLKKNGSIIKKCAVCGKVASTTAIQYPKTFKLSTTAYTYNGSAKKPTVSVKDAAGKTISSSNYTVKYDPGRINVGTYKVTVTMKGNYSGTKTLSFKITPASSSKCTFKLSATSFAYNGKVKSPTVTVKHGSKTLKKNTDYTVTYASGRKNVGTYKVTIKMKGNYSGTKTLTFKVNPTATAVSKLTPASKALKITVGKKTAQVTGYQVQYSTSKSFKTYSTKTLTKNTATSTTLSKLKAKTTYYVRVRTYKTVGSTKYYSNWSSIKYRKTK